MKEDYGSKLLKNMIKDIKKMSKEEYLELYEKAHHLENVIPAPDWLKERMEEIKKLPKPSLKDVETQFKASAKYLKPKPPLSRIVYECDEIFAGNKSEYMCPKCQSSFKRKFIFRTKKCINPECENYYGKEK